MKLRILGDSIRFRLGKREVHRFLRKSSIEEATHFPNPNKECLIYELQIATEDPTMSCQFVNGRLTVSIPHEIVHHWATSDEVSIRGVLPLDEHGTSRLKILIEKDFECLDSSTEEPEDDAFPNPKSIEPA